jgi:hypothetical protein
MSRPMPSNVTIRDMVSTDIPTVVDFTMSAMATDPLDACLHPERDKYPLTCRERFVREVKEKLYSKDWRCFVAEGEEAVSNTSSDSLPSTVSKTKRVVGWSCWRTSTQSVSSRALLDDTHGTHPRNATILSSTFMSLNHCLLQLEPHYQSILIGDRSASLSELTTFHAHLQPEPFAHLPPCLVLAWLVVDPAFQRRGIGNWSEIVVVGVSSCQQGESTNWCEREFGWCEIVSEGGV